MTLQSRRVSSGLLLLTQFRATVSLAFLGIQSTCCRWSTWYAQFCQSFAKLPLAKLGLISKAQILIGASQAETPLTLSFTATIEQAFGLSVSSSFLLISFAISAFRSRLELRSVCGANRFSTKDSCQATFAFFATSASVFEGFAHIAAFCVVWDRGQPRNQLFTTSRLT